MWAVEAEVTAEVEEVVLAAEVAAMSEEVISAAVIAV
jgi:hypothetical protein